MLIAGASFARTVEYALMSSIDRGLARPTSTLVPSIIAAVHDMLSMVKGIAQSKMRQEMHCKSGCKGWEVHDQALRHLSIIVASRRLNEKTSNTQYT